MARGLLAAFVLGLLLAVAPATAGAQEGEGGPAIPLTALEVRGTAPPQAVKGTDGRWHIEYDLTITNTATAPVTLTGLTVRDPRGGLLLRLEGEDQITEVTGTILPPTPTSTVEPSQTVQTVVDAVVPREGRVPARVTNRVSYTYPADALFGHLIGSREVDGPVLQVPRRKPIVVKPPLRGSGWIAFNACCEPSSHRSFVLAANGRLVTPEVFAIDWIQEQDGRVAEGDGSQNSQWAGYREPVFAVASGRVVSVQNGQPEIPPGVSTADNPTLTDADSFGGNHVLLRLRRGVYALYAHMVTGSVRVKKGERVKTGQQIGLLGNSGNTSAPHLHFGLIESSRGLLSSDSLPFVIDRFTYGGQAEFSETGPEVTITGTPRPVRNAHPLTNSIANFSP
jgi:murein DD-endopeptidase MepM/ murein hydrolase activator NlpD